MPRYRYDDWSRFAQPTADEVGARARRAKQQLGDQGREMNPVEPVTARLITTTFWGKAWCRNLLQYSDYANRMPRGRSYVRHGSVVHLTMDAGEIEALVSGSRLYEVAIRIGPVPKKHWESIRSECSGEIESLVELLEGKPPRRVMEIVTRPGDGLFPTPKEIEFGCSCPDWAAMCKHVAAVLYGVGVRLDSDPEQLFRLRGVDPTDLVSTLAEPAAAAGDEEDALVGEDLSAMFGITLEDEDPPPARPARKKATRKKASRKKVSRRKAVRGVTRKRAVRKKAVRKKVVRRKVVRKKAARKVARRVVRQAATRKKAGSAGLVGRTIARKKVTRKTATRKKVTRKKVVRKKATRKVVRKKIVRKKVRRVWSARLPTDRKQVVRKKAVRRKVSRKKATRKKATGKKEVRRVPRRKAARKKTARKKAARK